MRTLLLMRGAPGSGKSTWIQENGLEPYTLEADRIRTLVANPELNLDGNLQITQANDKHVWQLLFELLEKRMQRGEFTVIDATHSNPNMIRKYKKLIEKYQYRCYYKEINLPLATLLERNANRPEFKRVPDEAIKRIYHLMNNTPIPNYVHQINDLNEIINYHIDDLNNKFDKVKIIGDIQGCYSVLIKAIGTTDEIINNPRTLYVFSGDLLDRGLENYEVLQYMIRIHQLPNVRFVVGNHDEHLKNWATDNFQRNNDGQMIIPHAFKKTEEELRTKAKENGVSLTKLKQDTRRLIRKMTLAFPFILGDKKIFVCHAGISAIPNMTIISGLQLIRGVGKYEDEIDQLFEQSYKEGKTQGFTQVHGHRRTTSTEHSICLESDVENGLYLSVLEVENEKPLNVQLFKNDVYYQPEHNDEFQTNVALTKNKTTNELLTDNLIKVKTMNDYPILSLNFKEKAFKKGIWNNRTTKARGLFIDKESGDIVMRSYDKFFNLNEEGNTINDLSKKMTLPLYAYKKYNGFLGIVSAYNGELLLATKSTINQNTTYVQMFQEIFNQLDQKEKEQLKTLSETYHCSFVFEVCHVNDKHIIDFDRNQLILLDAIPNTYKHNGENIDIQFSKNITAQVNCISGIMRHKEFIGSFHTFADLMRYVENNQNDQLEGLVINDDNGYMFKIKYNYYKYVKRLRSVLQMVSRTYANGIKFNTLKNEDEIQFAAWLAKHDYATVANYHIIDAYRDYCNESRE